MPAHVWYVYSLHDCYVSVYLCLYLNTDTNISFAVPYEARL